MHCAQTPIAFSTEVPAASEEISTKVSKSFYFCFLCYIDMEITFIFWEIYFLFWQIQFYFCQIEFKLREFDFHLFQNYLGKT